MTDYTSVCKILAKSLLLVIILVAGGCVWGPFADYSVHKTPFNTGWEIVHLPNIGVDIELPKDPEHSPFPIYEIVSTYPEFVIVNMHRSLYRSTPEWGSLLTLSIHRYKKNVYFDLTSGIGNRLEVSGVSWNTPQLFERMQRQHVLLRKAIPPEQAIYRWDFLRCYRAPDGDVITASCTYGMNDEEDFKAIEHMIDSVHPTR